MQALKSKPPEQWRVEVDAISDPDVRNRVACLAWWDHFGSRPVSHRWPHLDKFLGAPYVPVSDTQLKRALCQCGYSPEIAHRRIMKLNQPRSTLYENPTNLTQLKSKAVDMVRKESLPHRGDQY